MTPRYFRSNKERYIGDNGFIETAREYWTLQHWVRSGNGEVAARYH